MTRAATLLHLTQPALSHQLADLERQLGAALFRRTPRGMSLTPAGERLLNSADAVLAELESVERDLQAGRNERAFLRISTECYTCYHWLPGVIRRFQTRFPQVDVRVAVEATREPLAALTEGKIDVAIVTEAPKARAFDCRPLFEDELVAIVGPRHRLAGKAWLGANDFASETLITYSIPLEQMTVYQQVMKPAGVVPARTCPIELTEAVIEMVKAGLGIAVLARWAVAPVHGHDRRTGEPSLREIRVTRRGLRRRWFAVTTRMGARQPQVREFVDLIASEGKPFQ